MNFINNKIDKIIYKIKITLNNNYI